VRHQAPQDSGWSGRHPAGKNRQERSLTTPQIHEPFTTPPPEAWPPLLRLAKLAGRPLERFLHIEAASGILLVLIAGVSLTWANSSWRESYYSLWHTPLGVRIGGFAFERSLEWVVNDGLMVIFFFVVGMEIRREVHEGELSEWRRAALPAAAALGGMLAPAALYIVFAGSPELRSGWGVPMATDIAFAVGILTLLGKRVPAALRVLLLALAVIDDLGAIVVIALFYSSGIALSGLAIATAGFVGVLVMQRFGVRSKLAYIVPSLVAWAGIYMAGIHPTIAGVIVGLLTPVRAWLGPSGFIRGIRNELTLLEKTPTSPISTHALDTTLDHVDRVRREAISPADSLIRTLHPWVAFGIMPVFALANAGVTVSDDAPDSASWRVIGGVAVGLIAGKPIGVLLACWLALRSRVATLPRGISRQHLVVLGMVAGVGFTMALFIAQLAFADARLLAAAKLGILAASGGAAVISLALGRLLLSPVQTPGAALTADEAEGSTEL
jgi:NhaA family Na+:H+ antiporter